MILVLVELRVFDVGVLLAHFDKVFIVVLLCVLFGVGLSDEFLLGLGLDLDFVGLDFFVWVFEVLFVVFVLEVGVGVFVHRLFSIFILFCL